MFCFIFFVKFVTFPLYKAYKISYNNITKTTKGGIALRNEKKIVLSREQYLILSARIRGILPADPHMPDPSGYFIASLYFDDLHDSAYYEKLSGSANRKKYRIRFYGGDTSRIRLECKEKIADRIDKRSAPISAETYFGLLQGNIAPLAAEEHPLAREFYLLNTSRAMRPRVAVTYRREAYIHPLSNTRITFDKELRAGWTHEAMCHQFSDSIPIFPTDEFPYPGGVILEIKYDEYIATYITDALHTGNIPLAASKYVLCRDGLQRIGKVF